MQKTTHEVLKEVGHANDPLCRCNRARENCAADSYFIERKLYPNIDFYSGITLKALGFPTNMFTVLFALARTVGWIAQWTEMIKDPDRRSAGRASCTRARRSATMYLFPNANLVWLA